MKRAKKERKLRYETKWNFKLLYPFSKDKRIEEDTLAIEQAYIEFAKKYSGESEYLAEPKALLTALSDWEKLVENTSVWKPVLYFSYISSLDSANEEAVAKTSLLTSRFLKSANMILFFPIALGKIANDLQHKFLNDKTLSHHHYFLKRIFEQGKYNLTEAEEKIVNLKSQPAYSMWVDGQEKLLTSQQVTFKGKVFPITEALQMISQLPTKDRRELSNTINKKLKEISHFAESEINAIYTNKKIEDELRGFRTPYSSTVLQYENDPATVENLTSLVTKNFKIAHSFYQLKAKLMGVKKLQYADRGADIGKNRLAIPFVEGVEILKRAFAKAGSRYVGIFSSYLENGQIDVYSKKGKSGGAFCSSSINNPTFVLLNYTESMDSVMTLGHEMGHAFHSELSTTQTPLYRSYSYSVAEVASTLFENFVFEEIFETLSDREKIIALHDRLNDDISTIFRQVACFNFELELHNKIRSAGAISKEDIAQMLNRHMKNYLGSKVELQENDGYFFVSWSHIRRFFYVYSYAFGQLISRALYVNYKKDSSYIYKIESFLSAGGSKSPEEIFKDIGIDVTSPEFFESGLKSIDESLHGLEKLAKSAKLL